MPKSGFTLVEILITLTVISFLAAVGLVVYSNVMQQGRNSQRQSDLRSIQSALEQYYSDQFFYPSNISFGSPLKNSTGNPSYVPPEKTYLNKIPNDPFSTASSPQFYAYVASPLGCDNSTTKCEKYCLYAKLEGNPPSVLNGCAAVAPYNFAVTLP